MFRTFRIQNLSVRITNYSGIKLYRLILRNVHRSRVIYEKENSSDVTILTFFILMYTNFSFDVIILRQYIVQEIL